MRLELFQSVLGGKQGESCRNSAWRYLSADTQHAGKTIACSKLHLQTSSQKSYGNPVEVLLQRIKSEHAVQVYKTYGMPLNENHSLCNTCGYQGIPLQLHSQDQILHTPIVSHFVRGTNFGWYSSKQVLLKLRMRLLFEGDHPTDRLSVPAPHQKSHHLQITWQRQPVVLLVVCDAIDCMPQRQGHRDTVK